MSNKQAEAIFWLSTLNLTRLEQADKTYFERSSHEVMDDKVKLNVNITGAIRELNILLILFSGSARITISDDWLHWNKQMLTGFHIAITFVLLTHFFSSWSDLVCIQKTREYIDVSVGIGAY